MLNVRNNKLLSQRQHVVSSLGDCLEAVHMLRQAYDYDDTLVKEPVMWFRGQSYENYRLTPSLYRNYYGKNCRMNCPSCMNTEKTYGMIQHAEEMRYQNYRAKNVGLSEKGSVYGRLEWLEHMQHHDMKTRLLDWSESLIHALIFALEPLISHKKMGGNMSKLRPHIWVLFPQMLNARILNLMHGTDEYTNPYVDKWLKNRFIQNLTLQDAKRLVYRSLEDYPCLYGNTGMGLEDKVGLLFNLSVIHSETEELLRQGKLADAMLGKRYINPLYPLLDEYYMNGLPSPDRELPPLAFVQEHHSKRISNQRGVFTMFPFYEIGCLKQEKSPEMELMSQCYGTIFKIELTNYDEIARELTELGMTRDWLYPEDPIVSESLEI